MRAKFINEEEREVNGVEFDNTTQDNFPHIESALNSLKNNFGWWKENWETLEQLIVKYLKEESEEKNIRISSRFTVFHGVDEKVDDVIFTGPCVCYTINGASPEVVKKVKEKFNGLYRGRKIFVDENQLIFLFG